MTYVAVSLAALFVGGWAVQWAVWIGDRRRCSVTDRRIGLLGTAESRRADRLRELGEAGTYRVHNCGKILHVDYDRGELVVERERGD